MRRAATRVALPHVVALKNGTTAVIRSAYPGDAAAWIENVNAIAAEQVYLMTERFDRTVGEIEDQFRDSDAHVELWLVAEVDGKPVGGADFRRGKWSKNAHTAELGIAVRKEWRGLGIGDALMRAGIEWARAVGIRKLRLGVFATNDRAVALYRKLGFVEEARLHHEVILDGTPVDEVFMTLWL